MSDPCAYRGDRDDREFTAVASGVADLSIAMAQTPHARLRALVTDLDLVLMSRTTRDEISRRFRDVAGLPTTAEASPA